MSLSIGRLIVIVASIALFVSIRDVNASDNDISRTVQLARDFDAQIGKSFLQVRANIMRSGWQPVPMHLHDGYEYSGAEKELFEQGIIEVDSCSIDAGALCILYYEKRGQCLRIDTVGERVSLMKVRRWTDECSNVQQNPV